MSRSMNINSFALFKLNKNGIYIYFDFRKKLNILHAVKDIWSNNSENVRVIK